MTVPEAMNFLLGEAPALGPGKPLEGYDMLGDHARALDLVVARAACPARPSCGNWRRPSCAAPAGLRIRLWVP
jgi:hypothetical protein